MPRRIKHSKVPSRVVGIVQERRAAETVEEALRQDRISELMNPPPAKRPRPKHADARQNPRHE